MFENYVCKIKVSSCPSFSSPVEGTAFGYSDGEKDIILTAGHIVTDAFGGVYPVSNVNYLFVIFENHTGILNANPVKAKFTLNNCNNVSNFKSPSPFIDSAVIEVDNIAPVSSFFCSSSCSNNDDVIGIGYPVGSNHIQVLFGKVSNIAKQQCIVYDGCFSNRFLVSHNSRPGCSGGPYVKHVCNEQYFVVGSLIGSTNKSGFNSIQSSKDF